MSIALYMTVALLVLTPSSESTEQLYSVDPGHNYGLVDLTSGVIEIDGEVEICGKYFAAKKTGKNPYLLFVVKDDIYKVDEELLVTHRFHQQDFTIILEVDVSPPYINWVPITDTSEDELISIVDKNVALHINPDDYVEAQDCLITQDEGVEA